MQFPAIDKQSLGTAVVVRQVHDPQLVLGGSAEIGEPAKNRTLAVADCASWVGLVANGQGDFGRTVSPVLTGDDIGLITLNA